jgi:hypothetical protein
MGRGAKFLKWFLKERGFFCSPLGARHSGKMPPAMTSIGRAMLSLFCHYFLTVAKLENYADYHAAKEK